MKIKELVKQMTLEEKAALCAGQDFWHTKDVERLDIPSVMFSDGPHGLRKQGGEGDHLGKNESIEAVCFPAACAAACSFDRDLMCDFGKTLGKECRAEGVAILLGPAVNIKRSPLCGRNFEYFSEDPYLSGELSASYIEGVQSEDVGTSLKHFAANNQETERMYTSSEIDERTLREIYLAPFETAVKKAQPWTVMCSYNKLNGVYASQNPWLLDAVLRKEWGFEGCVISDWGAVSDRVKGILAGMDLEMPGNHGVNDGKIIEAVHSGELDEADLDRTAERILKMIFQYQKRSHDEDTYSFNRADDHNKAVAMAKECMVLLKNEDWNGAKALPLKKEENIALIGGFAKNPRYQGGGSSHIHPHQVVSALEVKGNYGNITYAEGFSAKEDITDSKLWNEAVSIAEEADKIVVFAGLPDSFESEGYDREHMRLPDCQNQLIDKLCELGKPVIVVLHNGSPVELPWNHKVQGLLEVYLGGEGVGEAAMDVLYGRANPCGKLAETFPVRLEDNPSYLNFPGAGHKVHYAEGVFVGYRYYDSRKMDVLYPFGFGLSYTEFAYQNMRVSRRELGEGQTVAVSVDVKNIGSMRGKAVVQLYIKDCTGAVVRPEKELKGFQTVRLEPGETKCVEIELDYRSFAWYSQEEACWMARDGEYEILLGSSSRDVIQSEKIKIKNLKKHSIQVDRDIMVGELLKREDTKTFAENYLMPYVREFLGARAGAQLGNLHLIMAQHMPIRALRSFSSMTNESLEQIVEKLKEILE